MALVVNTNVSSIASQRYLMESRKEMETAMERLSSGKRINSAADDAAGLAIATRMDSQTRGLNMAIRNANDGISVVQSAEGAMQEVTEMLQRMRELAVQATSGANNAVDRASLDQEVQQLKAEINRIAESTTFNGVNLLDGSYEASIQIGYEVGDTLDVAIGSVSTSALGIGGSGGSSSGSNVLVSGRNTLTGSTEIEQGDIAINGVAIGAFSGSGGDNIADFIDLVNLADAGVEATAFNRVVASNIGTGIVGADAVAIKVGAVGNTPSQEFIIGAANSMDELVSNINLAAGGAVQASTDSDGRLVLANSTGASISIVDTSGTEDATDGGTGFTADTEVNASITGGLGGISYDDNNFNGFVQLTSADGSDITIERGNDGLSSPGTLADLAAVGFREVTESPTGQPYSVTGLALTSTGAETAIGKGDISLNGVEIWETTLAANSTSFQGKLDLINAFQTETGVVASAYFEKTWDFSDTTFVNGMSFDLNGQTISMGSTLAATVTAINAKTDETGIVATATGQNVTLTGNNVQHVTISDYAFDINDDFEAEVAAMADKTSEAGTARTISFENLNFATGVQLTLNFKTGGVIQNSGGGASAIFDMTAGPQSISYTVQSTDTKLDVAEGFRSALNEFILDGNTLLASADAAGYSVGAFMSAYSGADGVFLVLKAGMSIGSAVISFSVTLPSDANKAFQASASNFAAIRLTAQNDSPISIDLGSNATVAEHGLLEMNVGAADFDHLDPSLGSQAVVSGLSVASSAGAESALSVLDNAIMQLGIERASLGAVENRLDHTISNLANVVENTEAAKSRIQDTDFALESANLARAQILQQAGTAMLAQANAAPQNVLSLLG